MERPHDMLYDIQIGAQMRHNQQLLCELALYEIGYLAMDERRIAAAQQLQDNTSEVSLNEIQVMPAKDRSALRGRASAYLTHQAIMTFGDDRDDVLIATLHGFKPVLQPEIDRSTETKFRVC